VAAARAEARVDAVAGDRHALLGDTVEGDDVAARPFGDDEHLVGVAGRPRDDEPEGRSVEEPHRAVGRFEGEVVEGDHAASGVGERQRMLEVGELGPQPPQQPRQRERHPQLLRARREQQRLDPGRDELGWRVTAAKCRSGATRGSSRSRLPT